MENLPRESSQEIVKPIEVARFNERLSDEHETAWRELVDTVQTSEVPPETVFVPMWSDPEMPTAFRDRAMLYLIGSNPDLRNGKRLPASLWGYGFVSFEPFDNLGQAPDFDEELFGSWLTDLIAFEQTSGERVVSNYHRIEWALKLYDKGLVSESLVDQTVENYDIQNLLGFKPSYFTRGKFDADDLSYLPDMRVGILHDYISSDFGPVTRGPQYLWAVKKLHQWTAAQADPPVELPAWITQAVRYPQYGEKLYKQMCEEIGMKGAAVAWADIKPGIQRYGWQLLKDRMHRHPEFILSKIDDADDKTDFIHFALQAKAADKLMGGYYGGVLFEEGFLHAAIQALPENDVEARETLQTELHAIQAAEAERKRRHEAWEAEQKQHNSERAAKEAQKTTQRDIAAGNIGKLIGRLRG